MHKIITGAVLAIAAVSGLSPAFAQSSYTLYTTIYYDSPSYENEVGQLHGQCGRYGAQYTLTGSQSPYSIEYEVGQCVEGNLQPL